MRPGGVFHSLFHRVLRKSHLSWNVNCPNGLPRFRRAMVSSRGVRFSTEAARAPPRVAISGRFGTALEVDVQRERVDADGDREPTFAPGGPLHEDFVRA